jgi:hypothetical protein
MERVKRLTPLIGIAYVGVLVAVLLLPATPDSKASGAKVIRYFTHHQGAARASALLLAYGAIAVLVFFAAVASFLRRRGADVSTRVMMAGAVLMAVGLTLAAGFTAAGADQPTRMAPSTAQTLNLLGNNGFAFALFAGVTIAYIGLGAAVLGTRALPKAIGYISIFLGVAAATAVVSWPAFLATGLLTLVVSVYVYLRQQQPAQITIPDARTSTEPAQTPAETRR